METGSIANAAEGFSSTVAAQGSFNIMSLLNLMDYLNPFDGCVSNNTEFDYIIIGGGTSGCVLGNRLSEDDHVNVLVIEAGGDFHSENSLGTLVLYTKRSRFDWNYTAEPDINYKKCHQSSKFMPTLGKVLGGSSSVDLTFYSQGEDRDYDNWAKITGEPSWRFENVLRLFKKVERFNDERLQMSVNKMYHGFAGNVGLTKDRFVINNKYLKAFKQIGHNVVEDLNAKNKLGYTRATYYIEGGMRQNSAYAYLYPARQRTNLVILKNTQVTKILLDGNKKVVGVVTIGLKTNIISVFKVRREVIVAAGTFNTPKLLQLSGIGPKTLLEKFKIPVIVHSPNVGANYQNHVCIFLFFATQKTCRKYDAAKLDPHDFPTPTFVGHVSLNKSSPYADYRTLNFIVNYSPAVIQLQYAPFMFRYKHIISDQWNNGTSGRELYAVLIQNTKPKSRGTVQIRNQDPFVSPIFKGGFLSNDEDVKDLIKYAQDFSRILKSQYFKEVGAFFVDPNGAGCGEHPVGSEEYWRCYVYCTMAPASHHAGTAAMGTVVDGRLRVKGVKRLRVVDASVIPELFVGSITVPTMMIGENAAEMIQEDWKSIK